MRHHLVLRGPTPHTHEGGARDDNVLLHDRWAARMVSGKAIAAIAFAHLRRPTQRFWIRDEGDQFLLNGSRLGDELVAGRCRADRGYRMSSSGEQRDEIISLLVEPPRWISSTRTRWIAMIFRLALRCALAAMAAPRRAGELC